MLLLDTNVLSATMGADPAPEVVSWLRDQRSDALFTAAVCQAEIFAGIGILPRGRRRDRLERASRAMFAKDFKGRVLPFDAAAAIAYADMFATRRKIGRPSGVVDLMLVATARVRGASVATRNANDLEGLGLTILDPCALRG